MAASCGAGAAMARKSSVTRNMPYSVICMPITITRVEAVDIRFPTSREHIGSDAMNKDPDYSAAYCILHTDAPGVEGHGLTFTIGRGNELCVEAIRALSPLVEGRTLESFTADMG